jgi:outer membrane protein OmpA-like peptidoglycan-associated protein
MRPDALSHSAPHFANTPFALAGTRTMHPRLHSSASIALACALGVLAPALLQAQAHAQTLQPQAARITDPAIQADYATYVAQQARIKALNDSGKHPVASYSLSKAQCWLDVSFHEYSRNDRSAFPQLALTESFKITDFLARGGEVTSPDNPAARTPLVNNAARLRPDLWALAQQIRGHEGFRCAQQTLACGEVELVHGGNEYDQQQWRHAKPYVQIAEDRLGEAWSAAQACVAPPPASVAATPPPPKPQPVVEAPPPEPVRLVLEANVLFNFDRRDIANVRPLTKDRLDALIAEMQSGTLEASVIHVTGHADISNNTGDQQYNVKLAIDRAETIRGYMVLQGINETLIKVDSKADMVQVKGCEKERKNRAAYEECLLPNRRVEVIAEGVRRLK